MEPVKVTQAFDLTLMMQNQISVIQEMQDKHLSTISTIVDIMVTAFKSENKVLICGNGGSAGDAQHFAAELVARFKLNRPALPALALTTDTSLITAISNDFGFDRVFDRQVWAFGKPGDVLIGISTSGNSENVYLAMDAAKDIGLCTIGLLGKDGGTIKGLCDVDLTIGEETARTQEAHILVIHCICELVERIMANWYGSKEMVENLVALGVLDE
jgi:D-sedoheptulose 7-phosphate isomerase